MAEMAPGQYPALKVELTTDPKALGLVAMSDAAAADKLNETGASADTLPATGPIDSYRIINATTASDWTALSAAERSRYQTLTGAGKVDPSAANVTAAFLAMFPAGSATRTALQALANRSCSRVEKLFGAGVVVAYYDVARARALP